MDEAGQTLLALHRVTREQALLVRSETLPDVNPIGTVEDVPGTGLKVLSGGRGARAEQVTVVIGTHGRTHHDAFALQQEILRAVPLIHGYSRVPGGTMDITAASARRELSGGAQSNGTVTLTMTCASPYFWVDTDEWDVPVGTPQTVDVRGMADTGVRLTLMAGAAPIVDPSVLTDAGLTTWHGTVPAGGVLVMDSRREWTVTLNGADAGLTVTGPLPALSPGERSVTVTAVGGAATLQWREGRL